MSSGGFAQVIGVHGPWPSYRAPMERQLKHKFRFTDCTYRVGQIKRGQCSFFRRIARFREFW